MVLVVAVLVALKIASTGLPPFVVEHFENEYSDDVVAIDLRDVRLSPFGRASVGELRVFPKGNPLPAMSFDGIGIRYRLGWKNGRPRPVPTRIDIREADVGSLDLLSGKFATGGTSNSIPVVSTDVSIRKLRFLGTSANRVRIHADCDGRRLTLASIHANFAQREDKRHLVRGQLTLHLGPRDESDHPRRRSRRILEGRLTGSLVPAVLNPALSYFGSESLPEIFSRFEFPDDPPRADARFDIRDNSRRISTDITAGKCLYRGVPVLQLAGNVDITGDADDWTDVHVRGLQVNRPEGVASGNLHFDFRRHGVEVEGTSTIDFAHVAKIADILSFLPWDSYETVGGDTASIRGYYGFEESAEPSRLRGSVSVGGFSFRRRVPTRNLRADISVDGEEYGVSDIRGSVYGGNLAASVRVWPDPVSGHTMVAVTGAVENASTGLVNHDLFGGLEDDPGIANARFDFVLDGDDKPLRSATGHLSGKVRGARLFRTPIFAGFTDFLTENVPGLDLLVTQDDVDAEGVIEDNGVHFETMRIEGPLVSISGEGSYWFSDYLNFGVRVHLLKNRTFVGKALKFLLYPVSKLFEMEVTGPLRDPSWSPTTLTLSGRAKPTDEQKYGPAEKTPPAPE